MQFSEIFMAIILKTFREQIYGETVQQTERSDIRWAKRRKRCEWLNRVNVLEIAIRMGLWEGASSRQRWDEDRVVSGSVFWRAVMKDEDK